MEGPGCIYSTPPNLWCGSLSFASPLGAERSPEASWRLCAPETASPRGTLERDKNPWREDRGPGRADRDPGSGKAAERFSSQNPSRCSEQVGRAWALHKVTQGRGLVFLSPC